MVILSENPYTVPKKRLRELKVEKLILKGMDYQPQTQKVAAVVVKGMLRHYRAMA